MSSCVNYGKCRLIVAALCCLIVAALCCLIIAALCCLIVAALCCLIVAALLLPGGERSREVPQQVSVGRPGLSVQTSDPGNGHTLDQ
jgi:hypothetical protein